MIGQQKDLGSVEPGKLADFVIVEGDPLRDIGATKNVRMVIKGGQVMDTDVRPEVGQSDPAAAAGATPVSTSILVVPGVNAAWTTTSTIPRAHARPLRAWRGACPRDDELRPAGGRANLPES